MTISNIEMIREYEKKAYDAIANIVKYGNKDLSDEDSHYAYAVLSKMSISIENEYMEELL